MRHLARSLPRDAVLVTSVVLAAVALLAVPALGSPPGSRPCPDGLARVASWEPIEVADGTATVAFVLAPGCQNVDMSLVSFQIRSGRDIEPMVLHAATGRFSSGKVNRLTAVVGSDCAFRVVFTIGRPDAAARGGAVEAAMQAPDPCMYGADPVVVNGASVAAKGAASTTTAPTTTTPAPTRTTATAKVPAAKAPAPAAAPAKRPEQAERAGATASGKRQAGPAPAVATTAGAKPPAEAAQAAATTISGLASEPVAAIGVGPSGPLAGWDAAGLLGLALLTLGVGSALLWLTHPGRQR